MMAGSPHRREEAAAAAADATPRQRALKHAQACVRAKDELESQLREVVTALSTHGVRPGEPLVDAQGFPRADVDVYAVTHLRAQAARLRNDVREATERIKVALEQVHSAPADRVVEAGPEGETVRDRPALVPFAMYD